MSVTRRECLAMPFLALAAPAGAAVSPTGSDDSSHPAALVAGAGQATVTTRAGAIRGYLHRGVATFKGVPYGESTGGSNRFKAPLACKPWEGVRSCLAYGPISPQPFDTSLGGDEANFLVPRDQGFQDEDCLRLNVWTPALGADPKLPVMVFLHGGRYTTGSSQELQAYDGENLARRGEVVVVTLNHRLGVLGFLDLAHRDPQLAASGNLGLLDIAAALEWIHENIRNVGGDPGRVTLFGQSGGAGKVASLLAMPRAKGLFHRAIAQSGPLLKVREPPVSQRMADELLQSLGQKTFDLARLQSIDTRTLINAAYLVTSRAKGPILSIDLSTGHDTLGWAPVMDGAIVVAHPFAPTTPALAADIPLMIGTTLNELGNNIDDPAGPDLSDEGLRTRVKELSGTHAGAVIEAFRQRTPHATPAQLWSRIASAPVRSAAIEQCERATASSRAKVWLYWFTWQTAVLDGRPGAFHTSELPFVFNNAGRCDSITGGSSDAERLAHKMADAWTAFAKSGDPNHTGLPSWAAFNGTRATTLLFDTPCIALDAPDRKELASLAAI